MLQQRWKSIAYATTAIWLGAAVPAFAQPDSETRASDATSANDIVVTARRMEERLQDVPISVTVFNQQQIANRNIVNPADLATYTPSLSANRQYGTEKSSFSIRGFVQELGTQPSVGVYFADVVAPRAQGPTTSGSGTMPGTLFDLQNVQVLKGPQGTLFGRNTTGGAVLIVPQRPTDKLEGYVEGSIGDYDMRRVQAVINIPLADTFKVRLGVDRMTRDGFLRNRSGIGPKDFGNVNYWSARGSILAELTPTLENYTVATYNLSNTHGTLGRVASCARNQATGALLLFGRDPVTGVAALPPPNGNGVGTPTPLAFAAFGCAQINRQAARGDGFYDVENDVPNPMVRLEQWQVINTTTWKASDTLTVKNIASYAQFEEKTRVNLFGDRLFVPLSATLSLPFRLSAIEPGPSGVNASQYTFTEELQLQGRSADDRLNWQVGGYLEISNPLKSNTQLNQLFINCGNAAALSCVPALGLTSSVALIDQRFRFRNLGVYGQATYKLTDEISLTGGIRYTSDRIVAQDQNATARFLPLPGQTGVPPFFSCTKSNRPIASFAARGPCAETFVAKSSRPTWLIDLDYKPSSDVLLYAKYARGYRQGTINLLPLSPALNTTGPEKVDTYELGAKASFGGLIGGSFAVAAFYNDFSNQQLQANTLVRSPSIFPVNVIVNAGKSRIKGVEADLSLRPFSGFRLDAAYAYIGSKLKTITFPDLSADPNYSALLSTAKLGGPLALSPKNRVTVTGTYTLPLDDSIGRISVGATFTHTDKQFANHGSDTLAPLIGFNPGLLPATDLLNLNLDWNSVGGLPIDLSLFATNVTKEKYWLYGGALLPAVGYDPIVLGEPRMYGARLRFRFGN
ncbi:MAG: TonB-dependent receptor [Novosphingobium sp.]